MLHEALVPMQDNSFMHKAPKPGEGSELTRQVLKEYAGLHHQLTEVAGVKAGVGPQLLASLSMGRGSRYRLCAKLYGTRAAASHC